MAYFSPAALVFLQELAANNRTDWFRSNKNRYEDLLRAPYRRLLADLAEPLASVAPGFVVDQRSVGGSLFRIQRNTRFSHDKSPYNEWLGARFLREGASPDQTGELFMRVAARGGSEVGAGIVFPSPGTLAQIRDGISESTTGWSVVEASVKAADCRFIGRSLQRGPRGYDVDHPQIEALKRQACAAIVSLSDQEICSDGLLDLLSGSFGKLQPLVRWQHQVLRFEAAEIAKCKS